MKRCDRRTFLALTAGTVCAPAFAASSAPASYARNEAALAFIDDMVARHGFTRAELAILFARARYQPAIVRAMKPHVPGQRSWIVYRGNAVNAQRIEAGVEFWEHHAASLARAESEFGVPAEIVVGIIGVETFYGRNTGTWRLIDALATLAFDYPRRAEFFRGELEQYLLAIRESNLDALALRGSYAGAMGIPQFMPGSYRRYAVDFDGDGRRDLFTSPVDAIGSVANFLLEHGWTRGEPVAIPARAEGEAWRSVADGGVEPLLYIADLNAAGVTVDVPLGAQVPLVLVELDSPDAPSALWVGFRNFYTLTRYNRSSFYAIAVLELGQAVRAALRDSGARIT